MRSLVLAAAICAASAGAAQAQDAAAGERVFAVCRASTVAVLKLTDDAVMLAPAA